MTGSVTLTQPTYDAYAPTTVTVRLRNTATTTFTGTTPAGSTAHKWHLHTLPVASTANIVAPAACSPDEAGGHYNPFGVPVGVRPYASRSPQAYEVGDLYGKHGTLDLPTAADYARVYTDMQLPLTGAVGAGVIGGSVLIHAQDEGAARLVCAPLTQQRPRCVAKGGG